MFVSARLEIVRAALGRSISKGCSTMRICAGEKLDNPRFKAFVFDLDGTLLNTLPDLTALTNTVLERNGYRTYSEADIRSFVGDGVKVLLQRALPMDTSIDEIDRLMGEWKKCYPEFGYALTEPYPHLPETLDELCRRGAKLGALSNKFDAAAREVIGTFLPGRFTVVHGESADTPRKPDPTGLKKTMAELGVEPGDTAYIGDSAGDMTTAVRAGAFPIGVSWGYQDVERLEECGARVIVDDPRELVQFSAE